MTHATDWAEELVGDLLYREARVFDSEAHPRAPKGSEAGGQFAKADSGQASQAQQKKRPPARRPMAKKSTSTAKPKPANGNLAYDPKTGRGPGYGSANGDPKVHKLQESLIRLGITDTAGKPLKKDGKLGPKTTAAVKKAQKALGLRPDGVVTPALLAKLAEMKSLPKRSGLLDVCVRSFDFEARGQSSDGRTLEGYAAIFNSQTRIRDFQGEFDEVIRPGAFRRSLETRKPVLQWDHGKDPRIGTAPIGAIEDLHEDERGLFVRARLFDHPDIERVRMAIAAKAVNGMSFRFGVADKGDTWTRRAGEPDLREIRDADVHELGPVVFPAYSGTSVGVRSLLAQLDPSEHRVLIHELAAEVRLAVDLQDLTGRPGARSAGGGDTDAESDSAPAPQLTLRQRLDEGALRTRGILL